MSKPFGLGIKQKKLIRERRMVIYRRIWDKEPRHSGKKKCPQSAASIIVRVIALFGPGYCAHRDQGHNDNRDVIHRLRQFTVVRLRSWRASLLYYFSSYIKCIDDDIKGARVSSSGRMLSKM